MGDQSVNDTLKDPFAKIMEIKKPAVTLEVK